MIEFSEKQAEYIRNGHKRWNLKSGATRSGKTTLDFIYTIPEALIKMRGKQGLNFIIAVSQSTIERNVLTPMRKYWGKRLVGEIHQSTGVCVIFGERVICIGGKKITAVSVLRGSEIKFCYGDEVAEWHPEVFEILKSRLSLPYSEFHGACNPEDTTHFVYDFFYNKFDAETKYVQNYQLFDNPFLAPEVVKALCKEYAGTIYYDRYILGKWVRAEGIIYRLLADNPNAYIIDEIPKLMQITIGVDFGGNKSKHSFVATGFTYGFEKVIILESERIETNLTPTQLEERYIAFVNRIKNKYNTFIYASYLDSAEQVLIRGIREACIKNNVVIENKNALKTEINGRIRLIIRLLGAGRIYWTKNSMSSLNAFKTAVWDDKAKTDTRLDDGTIDIDSIDSTEYSIEPFTKQLLRS